MAFEIEEITKTIKKKPIPWAIGAAVAVVAGLYVAYKRNSKSGYITEAYPEMPSAPEEIAAGPASPGDISDAMLQQLLDELARKEHEDINELAEMNREYFEGLSKTLENYLQQITNKQPQQPILDQDLVYKSSVVAATPTITFHPKGTDYTPEQVNVMYNWAVEEQAALSKGYVGTSKNPTGLAQANMTMVMYPTGHVAFVPKGQKAPPTPSTYAHPALAEAEKRAQQVVSITGSKQEAEKTYQRIYGTGGHINFFGSEEAYAKAIVEKVKTGQKFSDPQAAKVYVTLHPELGIKPEQIK